MGMSKMRKRAIYGGAGAVVLAAAAWGLSAVYGSSADIPDSRLATVERGVIAKSVVATGKVEPITKIEIKSKANGIIKVLPVEVDQHVEAGAVLVELDRENPDGARAGKHARHVAGGQRGETWRRGPIRKNKGSGSGKARGGFARSTNARAKSLFDRKLIAQSDLEQARTNLDQAENRQRAAQSQLSIAKAHVAEAAANVAQAQATTVARRKSWPTPPSARRSAAPCSRATWRSAARCRPSSTWALPPRRSS